MRRWRVPAAGSVVAVLLIAIYVVGFHQPRGTEIAALASEAERLRAEQATLRNSIAALERVAEREPEFTAALELLERLIPQGLAQPNLLAQLQAAAQGSGVDLVSVTFGDPNVPPGAPQSAVPGTVLVAMPLTVIVSGPYGGIATMLHRIEGEKHRAVLVGSVAMTEDDTGFPRLTGTWSGQAYALLASDDPLVAREQTPGPNQAAATAPGPVTP